MTLVKPVCAQPLPNRKMETIRQLWVVAYGAAVEEETRLWKLVGDKGPGRAGHDPRLWQRWLEAVSASATLAEVLDDSRAARTGQPLDGARAST